jgi:hypothetical protein
MSNAPEESSAPSTQESYDLLSMHGIRAVRFKKLPNETMYNQEISLLSKACALLIMHHNQSHQEVINYMEHAIIEACSRELEKINADIEYLFNKRKQLSPHNTQGEQSIAKLTMQIAALENRKIAPTKHTIQNIIYDALQRASKNNAVEIPDEIYLNLKEYNEILPTEFPITSNDEITTSEKTSNG